MRSVLVCKCAKFAFATGDRSAAHWLLYAWPHGVRDVQQWLLQKPHVFGRQVCLFFAAGKMLVELPALLQSLKPKSTEAECLHNTECLTEPLSREPPTRTQNGERMKVESCSSNPQHINDTSVESLPVSRGGGAGVMHSLPSGLVHAR